MSITAQQARAELARRELAKRQSASQPQSIDLNDREGTPEEAMDLAKQQIGEERPNMPQWLRDAILQFTPKEKSPLLESAAKGVSDVTNYIPAAAGGLIQGASIPIRGVAGLIPTEFTQRLANSPDLRDLFPQAEGLGQQTAQMASEIAGGGGLIGKLLQGVKGASALAGLPRALQTPASLAATGAIATPGDAENRSLGAAGGLALGTAPAILSKAADKVADKVPAFFRGLTSKSTPESLVKAAQRPHDTLQSTADELYDQVRSKIGENGIKIPVKKEYLDEAYDVLPKTRASRKLIEKAKSGDYEAVHKLQSHLYKKGTKGKASDDIALENQGEEILDLRDKINDDLERHLLKEGHIDIAHILKQGKKTYSELMDTYFDKNLPKGIGKLVHSEMRLVPDNPEKLFFQNSVPMKKFLEKHPEVAKHSKGIKEKEAAIKDLNKIVNRTAAATGVGLTSKGLYDWLK